MALNTLKGNNLTSQGLKGLIRCIIL